MVEKTVVAEDETVLVELVYMTLVATSTIVEMTIGWI